MSENAILFLIGQAITLVIGMLVSWASLKSEIGSLRERVVAIEVKDEVLSRKNARIMHSPHNPYGMDGLIDKYLDRHYELTTGEWQEWMKRCENVIDDPKTPTQDKLIAAQLLCVCWHKLMMPPPFRETIERAADKIEDATKTVESLDSMRKSDLAIEGIQPTHKHD